VRPRTGCRSRSSSHRPTRPRRGVAAELLARLELEGCTRFGALGGVRRWVESIIDTIKGQLSLERHGAHTMPGPDDPRRSA
jgi:hypothetical protein